MLGKNGDGSSVDIAERPIRSANGPCFLAGISLGAIEAKAFSSAPKQATHSSIRLLLSQRQRSRLLLPPPEPEKEKTAPPPVCAGLSLDFL